MVIISCPGVIYPPYLMIFDRHKPIIIMCLIKRVQGLVQSLFVGIQRMPEHKQGENKYKIQTLLHKYDTQKEEDLLQLQKQLNKKLKFLQLAHPKIDFQPNPEHDPTIPDSQSDQIPRFVEYEELNNPGQYVVDTQSVREEVNFSNWADGNIDPEHLKRHKYLLDRQHFISPEWEGKALPSLSAVQYLEMINQSKRVPEWDKEFYRDIKEGEESQKNVDDPTKWETFRR